MQVLLQALLLYAVAIWVTEVRSIQSSPAQINPISQGSGQYIVSITKDNTANPQLRWLITLREDAANQLWRWSVTTNLTDEVDLGLLWSTTSRSGEANQTIEWSIRINYSNKAHQDMRWSVTPREDKAHPVLGWSVTISQPSEADLEIRWPTDPQFGSAADLSTSWFTRNNTNHQANSNIVWPDIPRDAQAEHVTRWSIVLISDQKQKPQKMPAHIRKKRSIESLKEIYSLSAKGQAYVPKASHQFFKIVDFAKVYNELFNLYLDITSLDPDFSTSHFTPTVGVSAVYYTTNHLRTPAANSIACSELAGDQISIDTFIRERLSAAKPIALADVFNVHLNSMSCEVNGKSFQDLQCVKTVQLLATSLGYTLTDKPAATFYQELLQNYTNSALYLIVEGRNWSLDPAQHASTICSAGTAGDKSQQDAFTVTLKRKFFRTTAGLLTTIVQSMQDTVSGLQSLFLLHIDTNTPQASSAKPKADLCQAIRKMQFIPIPSSGTARKSPPSAFLQAIMPNAEVTNAALTLLSAKASELCADEKNHPLVSRMYNGYVTMILNIKTYLASYIRKMDPMHTFNLPAQLPLLLNAKITDQDVTNALFSILRVPLDLDEMKIMLLVIENEKTNLIHFLLQFLPANTALPAKHSMIQLLMQDTRQTTMPEYAAHAEFSNPFPNSQAPTSPPSRTSPERVTNQIPRTNRPASQISNSIQADQPPTPSQQQPAPAQQPPSATQPPPSLTQQTGPTQQPPSANQPPPAPGHQQQDSNLQDGNAVPMPVQPPQPFAINPMPTVDADSRRSKRHVLTPLFSYLTGLASSDDITKLNNNEHSLLAAEESMIAQMTKINTQTNTVVSAIRNQSSQIENIYKDEVEVKQTLQALLGDTASATKQIQSLTAALEIFSDISVEFQTIFNIIDLLPELVRELHDSVTALASQSVTASLLPAEDISTKIPYHRRASLLAGHVKASITANAFTLVVTLPEFYPLFTIYAIKSVPFHPTPPDNYYMLKLDPYPIAVNNEGTTFAFDPALCDTNNAITVCSPHLITLRHKPTTCSEALVTDKNEYANLCFQNVAIFKPATQSYIYVKSMSRIRIFSPYPDTLTHLCGLSVETNKTQMAVGYTDLTFFSDCTLKSSELTLLSPYPPVDINMIRVRSEMPDLTRTFDALQNSIETVHKINLTQLTEDYNKLTSLISHEIVDIKAVQPTLRKAAAIQSLSEFSILTPKLDEPDSLTTAVKVGSYLSVTAMFIILFLIMHCCCPNITTPIIEFIQATVIAVFSCLTACCTSVIKKGNFTPLSNIPLLTPRSARRTESSAPPASPQQQAPIAVKFRKNKQQATAAERQPLASAYSNVQNQLAEATSASDDTRDIMSLDIFSNRPTPTWKLITKGCRARLRIIYGDTAIFYDSLRNLCVDADGTINTTCSLPCPQTIEHLRQVISTMPHPTMIELNGVYHLEEDTSIVLDEIDNRLKDTVSRQILDGYNIPPKRQSMLVH